MSRRSQLLVLAIVLVVAVVAAVLTGFGGSGLPFSQTDSQPESEATPESTSTAKATPTPTRTPSGEATTRTATSTPTPMSTPSPVPTSTLTPTRAPSEGYTDMEFYRALDKTGITVDRAQFEQREQDNGNLSEPLVLQYTTRITTADARREEIGTIARVYAQAVEQGYQRSRVNATAFNVSGRPVATYSIERSWALAYAQGEISAEEYGQRIAETYRSAGDAVTAPSGAPTEDTSAPTTTAPTGTNGTATTAEPDTEIETEASERRSSPGFQKLLDARS